MATSDQRSAPRILGLTGPIACGKTTVGSLLLGLGALDRIDADEEVHSLMAAGTPTSEEISREFGEDVIQADGEVDRRRLGRIVFSDPNALERLEQIVHPAVRRRIRARIDGLTGHTGIVIVDAVKLLQSDLVELCDAVWVVTCDRDTEMRRLIEVRGMTQAEADGRLRAQPTFDHPAITYIVDNSDSLDTLKSRVEAAWRRLEV